MAQNQYIYRIEATRLGMLVDGPTEDETRIVGEHFAYLERLVTEGTVLMAGRTRNANESTFGIVIFLADSDANAQRIVDEDPAVRHGIMRAEVFPYQIALWASDRSLEA